MTEAEKTLRIGQGNQLTTEEGTTKFLDRQQVSKKVSQPQAKK